MAGAMRKMAVYLGLVEDEEHDGYDDEIYDETTPSVVRRTDPPAQLRVTRPDETAAPAGYPPARRAVAEPAEAYRITTMHPRTYNEARTIGEHFREGIPVIMNLTDMDDSDAKRLVDFSAGLVFGMHGSIERVTNKVFLLTPVNIEITAEDKSMIAEGGFFNQS
ncbi:MAG: cell division inhibitor SepF [Frankiaceae bacterium]|jgi:cell division inhibitor SepF|nr:cell division inhibitor SepF [Frankiaceae bacterium]